MSESQVEPEQDTPVEAPESPSEPTEPEVAPEPDQEPEGPEDQPPQEPEPAGASQREIEELQGRLDKEATRHANRVSELMGEAANDLEPCPRCLPNIPGFVLPYEIAPVVGEQKDAVLASIGEGGLTELKKSEITRACEHCDGSGQWLSGSKVPNLRVINCSYCSGKGYVSVGGPAPGGAVAAGNGQGETATVEPVPVADGADIFGRPPGDPNFGMHPMYVR